MLYNLVIAPIETIVEWVFTFIINKIPGVGVIGAVIGVSLAINFLALPLYNIAESLQEKERKIAKSLEGMTKRIKQVFTGDERFMILATYYRQNNYHPVYSLRSSLSIMIEIPFFIAAYHYLSHNEILKGASWWFFDDLGAPDTFFSIAGFPIHILPILMTIINLVSGAIYAKEAPVREKVQLYGVASVFLVLLYNSPSGLVIYWILNNIFSLAKNIVMKTKHPGKILHIVISAILLACSIYFFTKNGSIKKKAMLLAFSVVIASIPFWKRKISDFVSSKGILEFNEAGNLLLLIFSGLGTALLCGFVLPSSIIATSPIEFSFLGGTENPLSYIWSNFWIFAGMFVFWPIVIYKMFGKNVKSIMPCLLFVVFLCAIANAFLFNFDYGNLEVTFHVDSTTFPSSIMYSLVPVVFFIAILALVLFLKMKHQQVTIVFVSVSLCLGEILIGSIKTKHISEEFQLFRKGRENNTFVAGKNHIEPVYHLSRENKNVVVVFLDRAIGVFAKQIFDEYPEIKKQFDGFVYYPNTLSFSTQTIEGTPPMLGGYEYVQENMNSRSSELLSDKHNESILVMPKIFADAGFEVTVTDPPWPNYRWSGDLENLRKYPEINVSEVEGIHYDLYVENKGLFSVPIDMICRKELFNFCVMESIYPVLRSSFQNFRYNWISLSGIPPEARGFFSQLSNLYYLPDMTAFDSEENTFTFLENEATHEVYVKLNDDFETLSEDQSSDIALLHYQANIAVLKQIGKWLDYLRKNDCYDNTRIIIVSDHGRWFEVPPYDSRLIGFNPLFMVKDFDSNETIKEDLEFMTNADTLFFAKEGLNVSDENPFTHKKFVQDKSDGINIFRCVDWNAENYRGKYQFNLDMSNAWHVSENIFDKNNWKSITEWENQKSSVRK